MTKAELRRLAEQRATARGWHAPLRTIYKPVTLKARLKGHRLHAAALGIRVKTTSDPKLAPYHLESSFVGVVLLGSDNVVWRDEASYTGAFQAAMAAASPQLKASLAGPKLKAKAAKPRPAAKKSVAKVVKKSPVKRTTKPAAKKAPAKPTAKKGPVKTAPKATPAKRAKGRAPSKSTTRASGKK